MSQLLTYLPRGWSCRTKDGDQRASVPQICHAIAAQTEIVPDSAIANRRHCRDSLVNNGCLPYLRVNLSVDHIHCLARCLTVAATRASLSLSSYRFEPEYSCVLCTHSRILCRSKAREQYDHGRPRTCRGNRQETFESYP